MKIDVGKSIFIIACILIAIFYGITFYDLWGDDIIKRKEAVIYLTKAGLIPFAFLNGIRHIAFSGNIIETKDMAAKFFEMEAGGANIAVGVAGLVNVLVNTSLDSYAIIYIIYGVYLFIGLLTSIWASRPILLILGFVSIVFLMISTGVLCLKQ